MGENGVPSPLQDGTDEVEQAVNARLWHSRAPPVDTGPFPDQN